MGAHTIDKLGIQANQIAVPQLADHVKKFWDPRMRARMATHVTAGGAGLDPLARSALQQALHS